MQLNRVEAFDLLRFMPTAGAVRLSDELSNLFYELRERLLEGERVAGYERDWMARYLRDVRATAPQQWAFVYNWVLELLEQGDLEELVDRGNEPMDWEPLQPALTMLAPLGRSMLRHTRGLLREYQKSGDLEANLAWRHVHATPVPLKADERQLYDELQDYCAELAQRIATNMEQSRQRAAVGFYLSFLRQRFSSSFYALAQSLERRLEKIQRTLAHQERLETRLGQDEELEELAVEEAETLVLQNRTNADLLWEGQAVKGLLADLHQLTDTPRKTQKLLQILQERGGASGRVRPLVVFTRYGDTLHHLDALLARRLPDCPMATFSGEGGWVRWPGRGQGERQDRTAIKRLFLSGSVDILLCTDAAAEGLNLQCADLLVNFDLPWNPMLLEQRIGRVDRIGQKHEKVHVLNLMYQGTVEEVVYNRLVQRFKEAMKVTGDLQFSLLPIEEEDFVDLAKAAGEEGKIDEEELIRRAQKKAERLKERWAITEFKPAHQKTAYEAMERDHGSQEPPVTLEAIWQALTTSSYLQACGCGVEHLPQGQAFRVQGVPDVPEDVLLTITPDLYDQGLPAGDDRRLLFATYGEPVFERLLNTLLASDPEILKAWREGSPLEGVRCSSGQIVRRWSEIHASVESGAGSLEPVPRSIDKPRATRQRSIGRSQRRILDYAAAAIAEDKLGDQPDSVNNHVQRLDQFRRSKELQGRIPVFRQPLKIPERAELLAYREVLLWPLSEIGSDIAVHGGPLLIRAITSTVERHLQAMKRDERTAAQVARRIRSTI
ncbi:MAG: helicase-related protein [Halorhodospira sp.]